MTSTSICDGGAAGKDQRDVAGGRVGRLEGDGEEFQDRVRPTAVEAAGFHRMTRSKVSAARRRSNSRRRPSSAFSQMKRFMARAKRRSFGK